MVKRFDKRLDVSVERVQTKYVIISFQDIPLSLMCNKIIAWRLLNLQSNYTKIIYKNRKFLNSHTANYSSNLNGAQYPLQQNCPCRYHKGLLQPSQMTQSSQQEDLRVVHQFEITIFLKQKTQLLYVLKQLQMVNVLIEWDSPRDKALELLLASY